MDYGGLFKLFKGFIIYIVFVPLSFLFKMVSKTVTSETRELFNFQ